MKQFKIGIELYFWDYNLYKSGTVHNLSDLMKVKCKGNGYTKPSCIFENLTNLNKNDLIIIITDGYFDNEPLKKYCNKFKRVVWIISGNQTNDTIPFGSTTYIKNNI